MSHNRMLTFDKYVANRIARRFAHFSHSPYAVVHHVGRRSGKAYETPIMGEPMGDDVVIALTYGPEVDWYRNVLAAGHATFLWLGKVYTIEKTEPIVKQAALPAFPLPLRSILRILGTQHFVRVWYQVSQT